MSLFLFLGASAAVAFIAALFIKVQAAHRPSVHFPKPAMMYADLVLDRQPLNVIPDPEWCTDCGRRATWGHSKECPRVTGETCPRCDKPKRTAYVCHYCGFAGFVIIFDFVFPPAQKPGRLVSADPAQPANQSEDGSQPLSRCDLEDL